MKKDLELINKYGSLSLDLQSFSQDQAGNVIIALFNGEKYSLFPTYLTLKGVIIGSFLKPAYINTSSITPYGPVIIKVCNLEGREILNVIKTLTPHTDYYFLGKHHSGKNTDGMDKQEIEYLGFDTSGPKEIFHVFISGGIDGDFLCKELNFEYLDFEDGKLKYVYLDLNKDKF